MSQSDRPTLRTGTPPRRSLPAAGRWHEVLPRGLDFSGTDPLGIAHHPALRTAASQYLVANDHAPFIQGTTATATEIQLAKFCDMADALTFASGTQAVFSTLLHILQPGDSVILDWGMPPAYIPAVRAARADLHRFPSGSSEAVERRLNRLARLPRRGRIFLCVSAVSPFGSVLAELGDLVSLAAEHGATLIVDIGQDLGVIGRHGRGLAEVQGRLGQCDILLGSLSETFGVTAGLAVARDPACLAGLRTGMSAATLAPVLAAALSAAVDLAQRPDARARRLRLHGNALRLRNHLMAEGLHLLGQPSPVVPILLPPDRALQMTTLLASAGPVVPLITAPEVGLHATRWLVRMSSDHTPADIDNLAEVIIEVARVTRRAP